MCFLYHRGTSVRETRNGDVKFFYDFSPALFKITIFKVAIDGIFSIVLLHLSLKTSHISVGLCKLYQY